MGRAGWALGLGLAGCLSTPVQRVETLGARKVEVAAEGGISMISEDAPVLPSGNLALRVGVSDRVDLGLRLGTQLYEVQAKVGLSRPDAVRPVSFAPSATALVGKDPFGNGPADRFAFLWLNLPVLVGIPVGQGHQLVLGPGLNQITGWGEQRVAVAVEPRVSVGLSARLGRGVRLHPEVAAGVGAVSLGSDGVVNASGHLRFTAVVGLAVGSGYR